MSSAPKLRIRISRLARMDPRRARTRILSGPVQALETFNERLFAATLKNDIVDRAKDALYDELHDSQDDLNRYIRDNVRGYAARVARFFFNVTSPVQSAAKRGRVYHDRVRISFRDDPSDNETPEIRSKMSRGGAADAFSVEWQALAGSTIKRKMQRRSAEPRTFFKDTGHLSSVLTGRALGDVFQRALNFRLSVQKGTEGRLIQLRVLPDRGLDRRGLAALGGGSVTSTRDNSQILKFLRESNSLATADILKRLSNGGKSSSERPYRPFIQPALGYYMMHKLPYVLEEWFEKYLGRKVRELKGRA